MPTSSDKKQTGIPQVGVVPSGLPSGVASFLLQLKRTVEFVRDGTKAHNTIIQSGAISGPATGIQPASVGSTGSGSGSGATFGINLYSKEQELITQLDTEQYKDASVTGAKIAAGSLSAEHISAGSITADTISVNQLSDLSAVLGQVKVTTAGYFYSGMTAYDTGTGWWMEYNSGNPRISFGDATGSHFTYDTTNGLQLYNSSNVLIFAVTAIDPNGKALIDFTQTGHTGKFLTNIGDDATYTKTLASVQTGNVPDLSKGILGKTLLNIGDGATRFAWLSAQQTALVTNSTPNHILDPTFTNVALFWGANGTADGVGGLEGGTLAINANNAGLNQDGRSSNVNIPIALGDYIAISFAIKTAGTGTAGGSFVAAVYNADGTSYAFIDPGSQSAVGTYSAILHANALTTPTGYVRVYSRFLGGASGGTAPVLTSPACRINHETIADANGAKAYIDFTDGTAGGHVGKVLANIADDNSVGGRYAISVGLLAGRPAAGTVGRMYLSTDSGTNGIKYRDTGTVWEVAGVGHLADIQGTLDNVSDGSVNGRVKLSELTTGTVKQLNDGTTLRTAAEVGNVVSTTADVNGNYLSAGSTSALLDDQGLGNTANWGNVANIPDTLTGHNLSGIAQPILPVTSGPKHIYASDSGGDIYEAPIYGSEINRYVANFLSSATLGPQASWTQVGNTVVIPKPGQAVNLDAGVLVQVNQSAATTEFQIVGQIKISVDGGSTFTTHPSAYTYFPTTVVDIRPLVAQSAAYAGTPTGDIWIEFGYFTAAGAGTFNFQNGFMQVMVSPLVNGAQQGGALSASILATAVDSCSAVYPSTTCQPSKALTVNATGGVTPYTYSNAIVSGGTDGGATISSGATSQTFTIKGGSQTATSGGASYTAKCNSVVTDSTSPTHLQVTTNTCVVTESYYLTYAAIAASMSTTNGSCSTGSVSGNCAASGSFSISASGGNGSYTYSNSITSQTSGYSATITSGATSASGVVDGSHATTILPGNTDTVNLNSVVNDTRSTGAVNATGSLGLTYKYIS